MSESSSLIAHSRYADIAQEMVRLRVTEVYMS